MIDRSADHNTQIWKEMQLTKNEAIRIINRRLGANVLGTQNTHWSNIVIYGSYALVWEEPLDRHASWQLAP